MQNHHLLPHSYLTIALLVLLLASGQTVGQNTSHSCGLPQVHRSGLVYSQVSDIDGNNYKTIVINNLVWFAENLKTTRFQNGDPIPYVENQLIWSLLSGIGMCSYDNDSSYDCPQGKLYNYYVAEDARNACPAGWRVPTISDYDQLINFFDPNANGGAPVNLPNSAGGALKNEGLLYWRAPNAGGMNSSGFSALPNGRRNSNGFFEAGDSSMLANYWYASEVGANTAYVLELQYNSASAVRSTAPKGTAACIRCVTDAASLNTLPLSIPKVNLFPNPATHLITLEVEAEMWDQPYQICDTKGSVVMQGTFKGSKMHISITELPAGLYYLRLSEFAALPIKFIKL